MILLLAACSLLQTVPPDKEEVIPFRIIDQGPNSGFQAPQQMFITSLKEWADLWALRQGASTPKKPHPKVDFDREVVILAAQGAKNTGGYSIEITRIVRTKDDIQVFIRKTVPGENSGVTAAFTHPFVLVRMAKPDRFVTFRDDDKK